MLKPMAYVEDGNEAPIEVIAAGLHDGLAYIVVNMYGRFPIAFVEVPKEILDSIPAEQDEWNVGWVPEKLRIDVHGGVKFAGKPFVVGGGMFAVGWTYSGRDDFIGGVRGGRRWTTEACVAGCIDAIRQLNEKKEESK